MILLLLVFVESTYAGKVIFNSVLPEQQQIALGINREGHLNTYTGNVALPLHN